MNRTIPCPDCQRPLRVPENLLGQAVQCPSCSHTFVAPESVEETPHPPSVLPLEHPYDEPRPSKRPEHEDARDEDYVRPPHRREKPGKVQAIAVMILVGGIYAVVWSVGSTLLSGFVCCFWPGTYYSLVMGIRAIIKGSNLLGDHAYRLAPPQGTAIMMIINIMNADIVNLTMGILVLVFLSDPEVKDYFRGR
jgi:hypothetical protein